MTTPLDALDDAAATLIDAVEDHNEQHGRQRVQLARPLLAAVIRDAGWSLDDLSRLAVAGTLLPDSPTERQHLVSKAASELDAWDRLMFDLPDAVLGALKAFRSALVTAAPVGAGLPSSGAGRQRRTRDERAPLWLIRDFLAAQKINVHAGASGSGKSTLWLDLMATNLRADDFLGRTADPVRWMVLSGEQSEDELADAFDAHGITDEQLARVHWTARDSGERPIALGQTQSDDWLRGEVESFNPDVLVIDSASMVCAGVKVNDNDAVAALYRDVLRPLIDRLGLTVLLVHHENKAGGLLGGTHWKTQADFLVQIAAHGRMTIDADGNTVQKVSYTRPKTSRAVADAAPEHALIVGKVDAEGRSVERRIVAPQNAEEITDVDRLVAVLAAPLGRGALAAAVGWASTGTRFRNALAEAVDTGALVQNEDRLYERGA